MQTAALFFKLMVDSFIFDMPKLELMIFNNLKLEGRRGNFNDPQNALLKWEMFALIELVSLLQFFAKPYPPQPFPTPPPI